MTEFFPEKKKKTAVSAMNICSLLALEVSNPYSKGGEFISIIQHIINGIFNTCDDPVDHVYHSIGWHLVPMNDPGTVHRHHLIINAW